LFSLIFQSGCSHAPANPPGILPSPDPVSAGAFSKSLIADLTASPVINSATISISNRGNDSVVMPSVFVQDGTGLNRNSILSFIRSAGSLTDEQFALATWKFISQHNQHYCSAGAPGDPFDYAVDPMRLLQGYGFTCCDQSTDILVWLWRGAGYEARAARMTFHEVPEISYHGTWHMYDADHRVYYFTKDNKTVASVADVIADPSLVARTADVNGNDPSGTSAQWMADQYAAAVPAYDHSTFSDETLYSLRSNQTFTLRSENFTTNIFHGPAADGPLGFDTVNSGQFDWELDFVRPDWKDLTSSSSGVETLINGNDIFLTNSDTIPGYVTYHLSSPFPVFSLVVSATVFLQDSTAAVNAYLMDDNSPWSAAFPMSAKAGIPIKTKADLTSVALGQYSYFVMLKLSGSAPDAARIAAVHITSEVQMAKMLFPNLVPGALNHLTYQDWSPATAPHDVEISVAVK
jgi:hypothetical protein